MHTLALSQDYSANIFVVNAVYLCINICELERDENYSVVLCLRWRNILTLYQIVVKNKIIYKDIASINDKEA